MTKLEEIISILHEKNASLVVCYKDGNIKDYYQNRINDIKDILKSNKDALKDAIIADKVIGKVAASILTIAGVKEIYADVMSKFAIPVLESNDISYKYKELVEYVINQDHTGMCPMENKYKDEKDINMIYNDIISN